MVECQNYEGGYGVATYVYVYRATYLRQVILASTVNIMIYILQYWRIIFLLIMQRKSLIIDTENSLTNNIIVTTIPGNVKEMLLWITSMYWLPCVWVEEMLACTIPGNVKEMLLCPMNKKHIRICKVGQLSDTCLLFTGHKSISLKFPCEVQNMISSTYIIFHRVGQLSDRICIFRIAEYSSTIHACVRNYINCNCILILPNLYVYLHYKHFNAIKHNYTVSVKV